MLPRVLWCMHAWQFAFSFTHTQWLWYRLQLLICQRVLYGIGVLLVVSWVWQTAAAGHPGVVLSDSYVILCESIGHMSPKSESLRSRSIRALWGSNAEGTQDKPGIILFFIVKRSHRKAKTNNASVDQYFLYLPSKLVGSDWKYHF